MKSFYIQSIVATCLIATGASSTRGQELLLTKADGVSSVRLLNLDSSGTRLVALNSQNLITTLDTKTRKMIARFAFSGNGITNIQITPNADKLTVTVARTGVRPPGILPGVPPADFPMMPYFQGWELHECNVPNGSQFTVFATKESEWPVLFDANKKRMLVMGERFTKEKEREYYLGTRSIENKAEALIVWKGPIRIHDATADGKFAAVEHLKGHIQIVDLASRDVHFGFPMNQAVRAFMFSPNGCRFVAHSYDADFFLFVGDLNQKSLTKTKQLPKNVEQILGISSDNRFIGWANRTSLFLWDTKLEKTVELFQKKSISWRCLQFSPDSRSCVAADSKDNIYRFKLPMDE